MPFARIDEGSFADPQTVRRTASLFFHFVSINNSVYKSNEFRCYNKRSGLSILSIPMLIIFDNDNHYQKDDCDHFYRINGKYAACTYENRF